MKLTRCKYQRRTIRLATVTNRNIGKDESYVLYNQCVLRKLVTGHARITENGQDRVTI